ncbi:MAG: hypothetical protein JZU60_02645 [Ilumatobacteraceae bacterium]|nr:hypothetical protein [Ilumatobacteraceae bacterium]
MILLNHVTNDITATTINGAAIGGGATAISINDKTAAYTVVAGDLGKIIRTTAGTGAITFPSCAVVGLGFNFTYVNATSASVTVATSGTDTLSTGDAGWIVARGQSVMYVVTDASASGKWQVSASGTAGIATASTSIGRNATASGTFSVAIGNGTVASGSTAVAIGGNLETASAINGVAIGSNSLSQGSQAVTGAGAVALGGSYASGIDSFAAAIGNNTVTYGAQANKSVAIGHQAKASSGMYGLAIGGYQATCTSYCGTAMGANAAGNGSQAVTGSAAMALGGSYASGSDSFAAAVGNSTATYGAQTANSVAIGYNAKATGLHGLALGYVTQATGQDSTAIGYGAQSVGAYSLAIGTSSSASAMYGVAIGGYASTGTTITGRVVFNNGYSAVYAADSQAGLFILRANATAASTNYPLTTNNTAPNSNNMISLAFSTCWAFSGIIAARQASGSGNAAAAWEVKGVAIRGASGNVSMLGTPTVTSIGGTVPTGWAITITADPSPQAIFIVFNMGGTTMNITVCATIHTTELFAI